jgi:hypothetical protein
MSRSASTSIAALIVISIFGCAGHDAVGGPIVDMKGVNPASYQRDLSECQQYASQVKVGQKAGVGAAAGAAVGGALGAIYGEPGHGAAAGAVGGGASGIGHGLAERDQVVKNCLRNRGYAVLN